LKSYVSQLKWKEVDMKKAYTTPQLLMHGSVQEMTLANGDPTDPKPLAGNDGCGQGIGQGYDGRVRNCS